MPYLTYCSFYSTGNLLPHFYTASLKQKWVWCERNVGMVKKSHVLCVLAPPTLYVFLHLCIFQLFSHGLAHFASESFDHHSYYNYCVWVHKYDVTTYQVLFVVQQKSSADAV